MAINPSSRKANRMSTLAEKCELPTRGLSRRGEEPSRFDEAWLESKESEREEVIVSQSLKKENLVEERPHISSPMRWRSNVGRSTLYELMDKGFLPYAKIGRSRRIPKRAAIIQLAQGDLERRERHAYN